MIDKIKEKLAKLFSKDEVSLHGFCNGYPYVIRDLGSHYCAYVGLPKEHPLYGKDEYSEEVSNIFEVEITYSHNSRDYWILGWDYAHACDLSRDVTIEEVKLDILSATEVLSKLLPFASTKLLEVK